MADAYIWQKLPPTQHRQGTWVEPEHMRKKVMSSQATPLVIVRAGCRSAVQLRHQIAACLSTQGPDTQE